MKAELQKASHQLPFILSKNNRSTVTHKLREAGIVNVPDMYLNQFVYFEITKKNSVSGLVASAFLAD